MRGKSVQEGGVILTLVLLFSLGMSLGVGYGTLNSQSHINKNASAISRDYGNKDFLLRVVDFAPRSTNPSQLLLKVALCFRGQRPPNFSHWKLTFNESDVKELGTFRPGFGRKIENPSIYA